MTHDPVVRSRTVVLIVMCIGYFLVLLDVTIVNVALPRIGEGLSAGPGGLAWVVDGYALALASLLLAAGTAGDRYGHRRIVLTGLALFGLASALCGAAPTEAVLVVARVLQGVGAALLLPGTLAIIARAFPERGEQARAVGIWASVGSVALPAGPLAGGALVDAVGWRGVFFVNVPIVAVAGVIASRVTRESREDAPRRLDVPGVVLAALALGAVTLAFIEAGRGGRQGLVGAAAALGVLSLVALLWVEARTAEPMLPLALFHRPAFSTANAVAGVMNLGTLGLLFCLTQYLQSVQHRSALEAGVAVLPLFAPLTIIAPLTGRLTARVGPRLPMLVGLLVAAAGVGMISGLGAHSGYLPILAALLPWGIGLGLLTPAVVAAAIGSVDGGRAGLASGVNNAARQAGGAIGIAAFSAVTGSALHAGPFLAGFGRAGLITAGLFVAAAMATAVFLGSAIHHPRAGSP